MLSKEEKQIAETVCKRNNIENKNVEELLTAEYFRQGNFVTCVISNKGLNLAVGITKRNPKDQYNPVHGKNEALSRAIKNLCTNKKHKKV